MNSIKDVRNNLIPPSTTPNTNEKKRDPRMVEAAKSFENQFIRQMISEMRKTIPKDELIPETMADNIFRDQLDGEYADKWVDNGGIGLADVIYDQLQAKYAKPPEISKPSGEFIKLPQTPPVGLTPINGIALSGKPQMRDIFEKADKNLFLAKKTPDGFDIRSREPLAENVTLRSPLSGLVLQASALEDGRQLVVIKHDEGLVSQFVHTGHNRVKSNVRVAAGESIAELPASLKGESANVFFGLRKAAHIE